MPTVFREAGLRFFFFSNENNEPAHVHVERDGAVAKFWLRPVRFEVNYGLSDRDIARATDILERREDECHERWKSHFGG